MGLCQRQHQFRTNQELLKENPLLDDMAIFILHGIGSGPEITISATQ